MPAVTPDLLLRKASSLTTLLSSTWAAESKHAPQFAPSLAGYRTRHQRKNDDKQYVKYFHCFP